MHLFKADGEHDSRGSKLSGRWSPPGHHCWSQGDGPGTTTRRARRTRSMLRLVDLIRSCFCFLSLKLYSYLISFNYIISDYFTAAQCVVNSLLPGCLLMRNSDLCSMQQDLFVERQVKHLFHCNCCSVEFVDNLQFHGIFKTDGAKDARASLSVQDPPAISLRSFAPDAVNVSHIFFTSGSTGRPKGCVCSFGNLLSYCKAKNEIHQAGISWKSKVM